MAETSSMLHLQVYYNSEWVGCMQFLKKQLGQTKLIFWNTDFFWNFQGRLVGKKCKKN